MKLKMCICQHTCLFVAVIKPIIYRAWAIQLHLSMMEIGNYIVGKWKSTSDENDADECEGDATPPPYVSLSCFYQV